jgi:hypothetical protein
LSLDPLHPELGEVEDGAVWVQYWAGPYDGQWVDVLVAVAEDGTYDGDGYAWDGQCLRWREGRA